MTFRCLVWTLENQTNEPAFTSTWTMNHWLSLVSRFSLFQNTVPSLKIIESHDSHGSHVLCPSAWRLFVFIVVLEFGCGLLWLFCSFAEDLYLFVPCSLHSTHLHLKIVTSTSQPDTVPSVYCTLDFHSNDPIRAPLCLQLWIHVSYIPTNLITRCLLRLQV